MRPFCIVLFIMTLISCESNKVKTEFIEIQDGIARFDIINNSNLDIENITFEIRYFDNSNNLLLADTVAYRISDKSNLNDKSFLQANEKTFIVQRVPDNCDKANIKILTVSNIE